MIPFNYECARDLDLHTLDDVQDAILAIRALTLNVSNRLGMEIRTRGLRFGDKDFETIAVIQKLMDEDCWGAAYAAEKPVRALMGDYLDYAERGTDAPCDSTLAVHTGAALGVAA